MSRLVVVSNRVPVPVQGAASAGGLAVALQAALKERGGIWFGWSGKTTGDREKSELLLQQDGNVTYAVVDLSRQDVAEYYTGFANRALWPLLHYRLDLTDFQRKDMAGYFRVNRLFAELIAPRIEPGDVVWVHDYHLIPLAAELRRRGLKNRIGFFLHIPWPPADVFLALPPFRTILDALTEYDLVGFQTDHDAENFAGCLARAGKIRALTGDQITVEERSFRAGVYPIGIETAQFARMAADAQRSSVYRRMRDSLSGRQLIVGVDRLDYSKGIGQRIEGFARFIETHAEARRHVTYLQITPKSRSEVPEYGNMQREVAELAGRVNGSLGDIDWTPIRYINKTLGRAALAGVYRLARIGLVTPLRDGMNLVAKEYVAAQRPDDPGALVLSRFAGAARELEAALLVNPYDVDDIAAAIARGLKMTQEERRERFEAMMAIISRQDVTSWCDGFLNDLIGGGGAGSAQGEGHGGVTTLLRRMPSGPDRSAQALSA